MKETMRSQNLFWAFVLVILVSKQSGVVECNKDLCKPIAATDNDLIEFALNLEFLEAEFFLYGALGKGLDAIDSALASGGPPPIGAQIANLDPNTRPIIEEFAYQEVGHIRAIKNETDGGFPRPLLNLSKRAFADMVDKAVGYKLIPPFDAYANSRNFLLAASTIPYVGLNGYVGTLPQLVLRKSRSLVAKLLGVEAGQDAVLRANLYLKLDDMVVPYNITVARFTNLTSELFNRLGNCGIKDEGLIVPRSLGAENRTESNILSADDRSLSYSRIPPEILRIVYGTGDERKPGGFFPNGANGKIAQRLLRA